ncbi:hypothetical protein ACOJDJ_000126 [Cronobacter dublinensis]
MKNQKNLKSIANRSYNAMIARVENHKNYQDVSIDPIWLNDREAYITWYISNYHHNWAVDKDILSPGSRLYSPQTCMFVPPYVNALFRSKKENSRGNAHNPVVLPLGVSLSESPKNPYQAHCKINGKQTHLGLFSTPEEAHRAWQLGKIDQLQYALMDTELTSEIIEALEQWINIIISDVEAGRETKLD